MKGALIFILLLPLLHFSQTPAVDSLYKLLKNEKQDSVKLRLRITIGDALPELRYSFWDSIISDSKKIGLKKYEARGLNGLATAYYYQNNQDKALEFFLKSLKIAQESGDKYACATLYSNLSAIYYDKGDIQTTVDYNTLSLKLSEEIGDKAGAANTLNNLSIVLHEQGDTKKALEYNLRSLKMREEIGDRQGMSTSLNSLAYVFYNKGELDKAMECNERALKIQEELGDKLGIGYSLNNMGDIYDRKKQYDKATEFYNKSLSVRKEINNKQGIATTLINLGNIFQEKKDFANALKFYNESMSISKSLNSPLFLKNAAKQLYEIYKLTGNKNAAYENYELYILMRDSLNNQSTKKASVRSQLKYEYEKKAVADSIKNAESQKVKDALLKAQNASLNQEKTRRYALIGGLILVAGFLIFVINRFRITSKQKKIIEEQKIIVDEAFDKLNEKNKEVMDSIQYAKRIQNALITSELYIERNLKRLSGKK